MNRGGGGEYLEKKTGRRGTRVGGGGGGGSAQPMAYWDLSGPPAVQFLVIPLWMPVNSASIWKNGTGPCGGAGGGPSNYHSVAMRLRPPYQ